MLIGPDDFTSLSSSIFATPEGKSLEPFLVQEYLLDWIECILSIVFMKYDVNWFIYTNKYAVISK